MIDLSPDMPYKIIVRMPNWVGDLVMATPILSDLRKRFPQASLTAMCKTPICELLQKDEDLDEVFQFTKTSRLIRREEKRRLLTKLQLGAYDIGIILPNSFSSAWWLWQGDVKIRIGYETLERKLLLTHPVIPQNVEKQHLIITYKKLLEPLGIALSETKPRLFLSKEEISLAKQRVARCGIDLSKKMIGINPGAAYGSAKCWLPERFREVTQRLLERSDVTVIYFGDPSSRSLIDQICQGLGSSVLNMAGETSLRELACLISLCSVVLTNDSGPMHIAGALGTKVVALFGSTNPVVTGPFGEAVTFYKHVECSPCYRRTCPIDFRCMKQIEVQEVTQAIEYFLNSTKLSIIS